ncbi:hypothetical protein ACRALDRAFT_2026115 [Sodiomyces alcalophilus JCM 7366]|uniref:uncharacterized protein n=1 Tax=Sodiomyces alcalophilus JCM 7366 TaxID=591952 RepID=UPI0039B6BC9C
MAANSSTRASLDDLDDYHVNFDDDPFRSPSPLPQNGTDSKKRKTDGLGIDEEVDVAKRARVPRVKLDETRLLSDDGIPKLRRRAAGLKFKGKGHEFSDAARLLTFYQFWLDDLFPKAKFLDALAMVEKAGHKRVLVNKRSEWIDELRPRPSDGTDQHDDLPADAEPQPNSESMRPATVDERMKTPQVARPGGDDDGVPDDEEDLYGATPRRKPIARPPMDRNDNNDEGEEDDLEALIAEAEAETRRQAKTQTPQATRPGRDDDGVPDDEEDIYGATPRRKPIPRRPIQHNKGDDEEDDLEALIAEAEAETRRQAKTQPGNTGLTDTGPPQPEIDRGPDEDEEAAMAEMEGLW